MSYYRPLPQIITEAELVKLLHTSAHYRSKEVRYKYDILFLLLASTGLRRAEVCNLNVGDIDFDSETLLVRHGKGGKPRLVPLPREVMPALQKYIGDKDGSAPMFPGNGLNHMVYDTIAHDLRKRCKAAHIERRIHPHMFRHTYATGLLRSPQANLIHVQRLLGHARPETTSIYTHLVTSDLEETIKRLPYRRLLGTKKAVHF